MKKIFIPGIFFTVFIFFIINIKNDKTGGNGGMEDNSSIYKKLDHPEITSYLFYPRPEGFSSVSDEQIIRLKIQVDEDAVIGANFFHHGRTSPVILFFHGNGEIISDYDDIAPLFVRMGINFFPVDYRGYGRSTGRPSVTSMMKDSHKIFSYAKNWCRENNYTGPFIIMGRSLGSASALELASEYKDQVDGLIIESGFAHAIPLMKLLGINTGRFDITKDVFDHINKIKKYSGRTLIIHAEYDHIIPFSDGENLFQASSSPDKKFLKIPGANHNTIFQYGLNEYFKAVNDFSSQLMKER